MEKGRLKFELEEDGNYSIENGDGEFIGSIERLRIGAWMSWCLLLEHECYMSAGCLDEVREKIRELNAASCKKKTQSD